MAPAQNVRKILYPVELTAISDIVAPWALEMALRFDASLEVLHVIPGLEYWGVAYASAGFLKLDEPALAETARDKLDRFCQRHFQPRLDPVIDIRHGKPSVRIIEYVLEKDIDMVVMGTHAQQGLDRALFGSVAEKVLRQCPVPVVCVNPLELPSS